MSGKLDLIIGSMFSGKSTSLLRKLTQLSDLGMNVLYINHNLDSRSDTNFSTHSSLMKNSKLPFDSLKVNNFDNEYLNSVVNYDVVGIDEAQFFDESLINFVLHIVEKLNKHVIITGLDSTFERKPFGHILKLIPYADSVVKLHAYCYRCFQNNNEINRAIFSHRINTETGEVVIGDKDKYSAVCRKCYIELN